MDTGGWLALALAGDPYHERAASAWDAVRRAGAKPCTSIPVVIETFAYLDRKVDPRVARAWTTGLRGPPRVEVLACSQSDLEDALPWLDRRDFHKLSLVDATSFVLLRKQRIKLVIAFDTHFAQAGFRPL